MARIDSTDIDVVPLCLGGDIFGWTADGLASFVSLELSADELARLEG